MSNWIYELIYESGGNGDSGQVQIGDLILTSGNYVRLGGVVFAPEQEIDFAYGPLHLRRLAGERLLRVDSPGPQIHLFEYRCVYLWSSRWFRYSPIAVSPTGEIDPSDLPELPLQVRVKERLVTLAIICFLGMILASIAFEN